jgi:hypothetical protein
MLRNKNLGFKIKQFNGGNPRIYIYCLHIFFDMLPKFLVISKYEVKQYLRNRFDEAIVVIMVLAGVLLIVAPEVDDTNLPSTYSLYSVGYVRGMFFDRLSHYSITFVPFEFRDDMILASGRGELDAFSFSGRTQTVIYSGTTPRSPQAVEALRNLAPEINSIVISDYLEGDWTLSGVLFPVRLQLNYEEIDYQMALSQEVLERRKSLLDGLALVSDAQEQPVSRFEVQSPPVSDPGFEDFSDVPSRSLVLEEEIDTSIMLPSELDIDFPFKSLYRNMSLLSPMIFLSILLSLSLSRERIDKNLENLFIAPLSKAEILLGKSFPYVLTMLVLSLLFGLYISPSAQGLKAALVFFTLSLTMASFSLFSALISRTYRELTFIGSFGLFAFFFFIILPNVFSGVNVLAFISPLDIITSIEFDAAISSIDLFLSILPYLFLSSFFASFTWVCFTSETIFGLNDLRGMFSVFYGELAKYVRQETWYAFISVSLLVPFIFIVESIAAYLLMPLGRGAAVLTVFALAAIEEVVKIMPLLFKRMNPIKYSIAAGLGFFLTEKAFNLYLIYKVYSILGGPYSYFMAKLAPTLAVHILSTFFFAASIYYNKGARRSWPLLGYFVSVSIHFTYNMLVLWGAL